MSGWRSFNRREFLTTALGAAASFSIWDRASVNHPCLSCLVSRIVVLTPPIGKTNMALIWDC